MLLKVDPASLQSAGNEMQAIAEMAKGARFSSTNSTLNGSFSSIDGLSGLAISHGSVLHGGVGSAVDCFGVFERLLQWAQGNFVFNCRLFTGQDIANGTALASVDSGGGATPVTNVGSEARPAGTFGDFSFSPPVASRPVSVDALVLELAATNNAQALEAATTWQVLATQAASISASLRGIVASVTAANEGLWVPLAVGMISEFASNAEFFAASAGEMSRSTGVLAGLAPSFLPAASQAQLVLAAITEPAERRIAEEAFLSQFHTAFNAALPTAVPTIRNLMQESTGGSAQTSDIGLHAASVKPASVPPALGEVVDMLGQATARIGSGAVDAVTQAATQLGGITPQQVVTHVASTLAPVSGFTPHSVPLGAVGTSMAQAAGAGIGVADSMLRTGDVTTTVGGMNAHSNSGAAYSPHASSASAGSAHLSAGSGAGIGSTTSPKTAMPLQTPVAPINSTGSSSVIPPTSAGTTGGAGRMAGVPLGGVPMTGAGHNQHQAKQKARHQIHKVQSLTAQYERDLNLRELLGEPPKVIPGVISSWVRNPRYKPAAH